MNVTTVGHPYSVKSIGGYTNLTTIDPANKTRSYSAREYVSTSGLPNFHLITGMTVQKIIFSQGGPDGADITATGVHAIVRTGETKTFTATNKFEVHAGVVTNDALLRAEPDALYPRAGSRSCSGEGDG